ncbi:MAG TPA: TetR/AcrR family transcriptional regulator [Pseudonocardia sp.]
MPTKDSIPVDRRLTKGGRTRQRILDSAAAAFARDGVDTVSMNDVAAAAGLQTGSLYFHFASKEALIEEVLREGIGQSVANLDAVLQTQRDVNASPSRLLTAAIEAHLAALHNMSDYASVVLRSAANRDREQGSHFLPQEREYGRRFVSLLDEAQRAGQLPAGLDPRLIRDLLFGAMNATPLRNRQPEEVAEALTTLLGIAER